MKKLLKEKIGDQSLKIYADAKESYFLLENREIVMSNALRYSSSKFKISIKVVEEDKFITFSVKDFDKGIAEQYQKRFFDRYYQVPTDGQNKSGSGLGLAISKDFIEAQKGRIWVESLIGEGSRFCFCLPMV